MWKPVGSAWRHLVAFASRGLIAFTYWGARFPANPSRKVQITNTSGPGRNFFHIFTTKKKLEKFAESQLLAHRSSLLSIFVSLVHFPAAALLSAQLCESLPLISLAVCVLSFQVIKHCPDKQGTLLRLRSRLKKAIVSTDCYEDCSLLPFSRSNFKVSGKY